MNFIAYCRSCHEELENGCVAWIANAAALFHLRKHPDHEVIIGCDAAELAETTKRARKEKAA